MLTQILNWSGTRLLSVLHDAGRLWQVGSSALVRMVMVPLRGGRLRLSATSAQCVAAGNNSLALVALISLLIGMILALQSAYQLRQLGVISLVANLVAVSMVRELAPLITAILVAGRVGSAITAELGTMKISQEIDALTVMGIDPVSLVVVPRMLSLVVAVPALTVFSGLLGILGGCGVGVFVLGLGARGYLTDSLASLVQQDVWGSAIKALVFGLIIGVVSCQQGLDTEGGADEVGRSTTRAVVRSIVLIIAADLFVTALLYLRGQT
jgi:phospholipid/cholesterol/gamma-HCH transport system permease protein